jgi:hypothetical protein
MRRRRVLVVLAGLAILAAGAISFLSLGKPDRISRESFVLIEHGMNQEEVEAILGKPGDYASVPMQQMFFTYCGPEKRTWRTWQGDWGKIIVSFHNDTVLEKEFLDAVPEDESPLDSLLWRAKRQWRKWFPGERRSTGVERPVLPQF